MLVYTKISSSKKRPKQEKYKAKFKEFTPNYKITGQDIPSLSTTLCNTSKVESPEYTGDKLIGIAVMHKSNLVPIFSSEEAESISKMRR